jgi:hypothetical protein
METSKGGAADMSVQKFLPTDVTEALVGLLEFSNGKLGGNPYLIPEYKNALRALARAIGWTGDWRDTIEHYKGRKLG